MKQSQSLVNSCITVYVFISVFLAGTAEAGETNTLSMSDSTVLQMSAGDLFSAGGWVMYPLMGLSLLTCALVMYFLLTLRNNNTGSDTLHAELLGLLRVGAFDDAGRVCGYSRCQLTEIVSSGLDHIKDVSEVSPAVLKDILEGTGARVADRLQGHTQYLLDIAVISPMLGLLGTVFGMLKAFNAVALDVARAKPVVLAAGVSEALITTAFGLMVGIPAMLFYAYFRRRASLMISRLESQTAVVFNAFCTKRLK